MMDESYIPRQQQLQLMVPEGEQGMLRQDDGEYSSHLQNEKKEISLQIEQLNAELKKK
jgi:hypothetical protein